MLQLERLEDRNAPATASIVSGVFTVSYSATGTTAEAVSISRSGTIISISGNVSGTTVFTASSVTAIALIASGNSTNQSATFAGSLAFSLSGGLTSSGVDEVVFNEAISTTGTSGITVSASGAQSLTAPGVLINAALTTAGGNITLSGNGSGGGANGNIGVLVGSAGRVQAGGTGSTSVTGTGAGTGASSSGVVVSGAGIVTSSGGSVSVSGVAGGASADGVLVTAGGTITSGGTGNVDIAASAGSTLNNVLLVGSTSSVTAPGGALHVNGAAVLADPSVASPASATFVAYQSNTFIASGAGNPAPAFAFATALPANLSITSDGTLSGIPTTGQGGTYTRTLTAYNGISVQQPFNLTINEPPTFTSPSSAGFVLGQSSTFNFAVSSFPATTFSETGALPTGVTLNSAGKLSGTPAAGTLGSYPITVTASNGIAPNGTQSFTLTVGQAPAITSASGVSFGVGYPNSFTVVATGSPAPTISLTSVLPAGVSFAGNTLSGTPAAGTIGTYPITFTAVNGIGTSATQVVTLTVAASLPIVVPSSTGIVSDGSRQLLYILSGTNTLQRFDVVHGTYLTPWTFGVDLGRADITPDGSFLYVTDFGAPGMIHKVDLNTGNVTDLSFAASGDSGSYDIKIASNGLALFDGINSSGSQVRTLNLATGSIAVTGKTVTSMTPISRSADGSRLYFDQASANSLFVYSAAAGTFGPVVAATTNVAGPTAVSPDGSRFAIQANGGVAITDSSFNAVMDLPADLGGYAFSPTQNLFFAVDAVNHVIVAYDTQTWQKRFQFPADENVGNVGVGITGAGAMTVSSDGTRLFLATPTDVRMYSIPQATGVAASLAIDAPSYVTQNTMVNVTVTIKDPAGNIVPGYRGTVQISSGDPLASVPAPYTFTATDNGVHTFQVALGTLGTESLVFSDSADSLSTTVLGITVHAAGASLLPALNGRDLIFDSHTNVLYVPTTTGKIERYDQTTGSLLSEWTISAGPLGGGDITPDGRFLYIADTQRSIVQNVIEKIDLSTGIITDIAYSPDFGDIGTWDLKIAGNGQAVFTVQHSGSGGVQIRTLNLATGVVSTTGIGINQGTLLTRSADYSTVYVLNAEHTYYEYSAATGTFAASSAAVYAESVGAASPDGKLLAAQTDGQSAAIVCDSNFNAVMNLPVLIGGFAFSPTQHLLFAVDTVADTINAYDTNTWKLDYQLPVGENVNAADGSGRTGLGMMTVSSDGSRLFIVTGSGVRTYQLPQSTGVAASLSVTASHFISQNATMSVTVVAKDPAGNVATGYQGTVQFSVADPAASLPTPYTFTAADNGVHTFQISLGTPGTDTLTVEDVADSLTTSVSGIQVHATGAVSLLPVTNARDLIADPGRNLIYIPTASGTIERYDLSSNSLLTPWFVTYSALGGGDITPDGKYLYVSDMERNVVQNIVWKIDLTTGAATHINYTPDFGDLGTWDLKIAGNGQALFTVQHIGSGGVQIRTLNLATGVVSTTGTGVNQGTEMSRAADYSEIVITNNNNGILEYSASTGAFTPSSNEWGVSPSATSRDGKLIAMQSVGFVTICNQNYVAVANLPALLGGYAFSPTQNVFYAADAVNGVIDAYDTTTWQMLYQVPIGQTITNADGSGRTGTGTMSLSGDGTRLYLVTSTGVRQYVLPQSTGVAASLSVAVSRYVSANTPVTVTVTAKDATGYVATGYRGTVTFSVADPAATLPASYTFTAADAGVHTFQIMLGTIATDTLAVSDAADSLTASVSGIQVHALGSTTSLPIANGRDMIYDSVRNRLYVTTSSGTIERYDLATDSLLTPWQVSYTPLEGGDITPDGKYLYVADTQINSVQVVLYKIDLNTGQSTIVSYNPDYGDLGGYDIKIGSDGTAISNGQHSGTGWVAEWLINTTTGAITNKETNTGQSSEVVRSADRSRIFVISGGYANAFSYTVATGTYASSNFASSSAAAANRNGTLLATTVGNNIVIRDGSNLNNVLETISGESGGVAFDPNRDFLYVADTTTNDLFVYNTNTWALTATIPVGAAIGSASVFGNGRMSVAADSSRVFLDTSSGVRAVPLPSAAPLFASGTSATFTVGQAGSFQTTAYGPPTPSISLSGSLPGGVLFSSATDLLSGTPASGTGGVYPLTFTATNGVGSPVAQNFTLTVDQAPAVLSAGTTFGLGQVSSFAIQATGYPAPTVSVSGSLPSGVTFSGGALSGTPSTPGTFSFTILASNGVLPSVSQPFQLVVADVTPPVAAIVSGPPTLSDNATASFAFSASDPVVDGYASGVNHLEISLDGGAFTTISNPGSTAGLNEGSHSARIRAVDNAGNIGSASTPYSWTVDRTPPVVTFASAPPPQSDNATARFVFFAQDPVAGGVSSGIDHIEVSLDGGPFATATSPAVFTGLTTGGHTFQARAFDVVGNVSAVVSDTWNVNLAATTETIDIDSVALQPSANLALDNDFTRFVNAFANVQPGDVVQIHGTLDWSESNALASWKATGEAYALPHVNNLTVDAAAPGDGVHGPGDDPTISGEGPFYFDGLGIDQSWNITGLTISNFDTALFYSPETDVTDYAGTHITNNTITVPNANPGAQNGGILLGPSPNQTVQGNTINLTGNGGATSASFGISSFTFGGNGAWNNLLLDNNTVNVTTAGASGKVIGIAENSGSTGSAITVTNNTFNGDFGSLAGNQQVAFGITSQATSTAAVVYTGNKVNGAKDGFVWGDPEASPAYNFNSSQELPINFSGTTLTNVGTGFFARDGGKATISGTTITNTAAFNFGTAFAADGNGSVITVTDPVSNFTGVSSLASQTNGGLVIFLNNTATIQSVSLPEGNTGFTLFSFPVMLAVAPAANQSFTVDYSTANGTADGNDYNTANGTLTFAPGQSSATIAVKVIGDFNPEPDETFFVNLSNPILTTNGSPAPGHLTSTQAIGTIQNDDSTTIAASIASDTATKSATMGAQTLMTFAATLNSAPPTGEYFTVNYHASNGTARGGVDFSAPDGTLTFLAGSTTPLSPLTVTVIGSPAMNPPETFSVTLDTPLLHFNGFTQTIPGNIGSGAAIGTLDSPPPSGAVVSINNVSKLEGTPILGNSASNFTTFTFTISYTGTLTTSIKVNWATANGSALGGQDYQQNSGQVTLTPTVTSQTISVTVFADKTVEPNETFFVILTNPGLNGFANYTIGNATGIGTIVNDD